MFFFLDKYFGIIGNKCFLTNTQSRFVSVILYGVLGHLLIEQYTCLFISAVLEAMYKRLRALKSSSKVWGKGIAGRNGREEKQEVSWLVKMRGKCSFPYLEAGVFVVARSVPRNQPGLVLPVATNLNLLLVPLAILSQPVKHHVITLARKEFWPIPGTKINPDEDLDSCN